MLLQNTHHVSRLVFGHAIVEWQADVTGTDIVCDWEGPVWFHALEDGLAMERQLVYLTGQTDAIFLHRLLKGLTFHSRREQNDVFVPATPSLRQHRSRFRQHVLK